MSSSGRSALRWFAPACALAVAACASSPSRVEVRTDGRLRVLPSEFTSEVGCSFASGDSLGLSHYAATLIDLGLSPDVVETEGQPTDGEKTPRAVGSSGAARCTSTTTFSTASSAAAEKGPIKVDHIYAAIVDGYAGSQSPDVSGDRSNKNWSAPAWQWLCGIGGLDETQLDWLVKRAQALTTAEYVPPATATSAPETSDVLSSAAVDASATATQATFSNASSSHSSDSSAPASTLSIDTAGPASVAGDGGVTAADAGRDAATGLNTLDSASQAADTTASSSDAGLFAAASSSANSVSSTSSVRDAGADAALLPTAPDAGARDWRSELSNAAQGDFAPPPRVVAGGQSGVRGCVPLF